jgi:uncharacterized membrane protein
MTMASRRNPARAGDGNAQQEERRTRRQRRDCATDRQRGHWQRRRGIIGLSLGAAAMMGLISLYQTGVIRHIPEPPLPGMDADKVDGSDEAYWFGFLPDGLLGLGSYAATAALAAMGPPDRAQRQPVLAIAMAGKVAADCAVAAKLTWDQWAKHKAFCFWCLLASGMTFAMLPLVAAETKDALHALRAPGTARR